MGKFRSSSSSIKILALGNGRLRIAFDLIYPYIDGNGEMSANLGQMEGRAAIEGDTAVFKSDEFGRCRITLKFIRPGTLTVLQKGNDCGFGHNVTADGTFRRVSKLKPKF